MILVSGYLQTEGRPTGMVSLWRELRSLASPTRCIELRSWCQDCGDLAELIWRCRPSDRPPHIVIAGYSWGGWTAILLARALRQRGLAVDCMVLCDAVYRHRYWLGNWRALWPLTRIRVPANVREVYWFRQRTNWPRGHDVVPIDRDLTVVHPYTVLECSHQYADDAREFHQRVMEVAA